MTVYSIGDGGNPYDSAEYDESRPSRELVRVEAESPASRIVAVIHTGDDAGFYMACGDIARQAHDSAGMPTPLSIAAAIAGGGATLKEVLPDGALQGWRESDEEADDAELDWLRS